MEELAVDPVGAREAFREVAGDYVEEVRGGVVRWGGRYLPVATSRPMAEVLRRVIVDSPMEGPWG